jgi:hypothetical protein
MKDVLEFQILASTYLLKDIFVLSSISENLVSFHGFAYQLLWGFSLDKYLEELFALKPAKTQASEKELIWALWME